MPEEGRSSLPPSERIATTEELTREAFAKFQAGEFDDGFFALAEALQASRNTPGALEGTLLWAGAHLAQQDGERPDRGVLDKARKQLDLANNYVRTGVELRPVAIEIIEHTKLVSEDYEAHRKLDAILASAE